MGLENTFGNVEKVEKEKKLEVIESEESAKDETVAHLLSYFEQSTPSNFGDWKDDFKSFMDYLQIFRITPEMITKTNEKLPKQSSTGCGAYRSYKGFFLSAMIQTSYNKGFNDFTFKKVNADDFGAFLKGKYENPIKITTETLKGYYSLSTSNDCFLEIQNYEGRHMGAFMKNCTIKSGNKETLETIKKQVGEGKNNRFELKK